jgi:hypothetical protein
VTPRGTTICFWKLRTKIDLPTASHRLRAAEVFNAQRPNAMAMNLALRGFLTPWRWP